MDVLTALNWRYAVDQFTEQVVSEKDLESLLKATCLSASSYGLQPYKIIAISDYKLKQQLLPHSYGQDKIANCSHLLVLAVQKDIGDATVDRYIQQCVSKDIGALTNLEPYSQHLKQALAKMTEVQKKQWAHQQAYIALGNLLTCAATMAIDSCPMSGIDNAGYDKVLDLEGQQLTVSSICPIGYRHPNDPQAQRPKIRFDYDQLVIEL